MDPTPSPLGVAEAPVGWITSPAVVDLFCAGGDMVYSVAQEITRQQVVHDYADVLARGVEGVLGWYGLAVVLSERERASLRRVLLRLGGSYQTRQMMRLMPGREPALNDVPETKWTLRGEELFRKVFLAELRSRRGDGSVCGA